MIHIANNWQKNSPLNVRVFSNCDAIELFLNDKSLGIQKPDTNRISENLKHPPFTFNIKKFEEGKLEAKGYINNKLRASHRVITPEKPAKIKVIIDNEYPDLKEENTDLFFVHAYITDKNGTVIPNYTGPVKFNIEGNAELIGENPVQCEAGIASIILKTTTGLKDIKVTVISEELDLIISNK